MRLRTFAVIFISLAVTAVRAQDREITLKAIKQPLTRVLDHIQKKSGYPVIYSDEVISDTILVSVDARHLPVAKVLDQLLARTNLFYKLLTGDMIVIGSKDLSHTSPHSGNSDLSGRLLDEKNEPVPFATVSLMHDSTFLTGTTGNEAGGFRLHYPFTDHTVYGLRISAMGYEALQTHFRYPDTAQIKELRVKNAPNTLTTVVVHAKKPLVERRADRYIVNVEGTPLADGSDGLEVLQKSPGVWVGNDGYIRIRGNQSVTVMINDVVQRMSASDLADYLRTLRSEDISKIEVIPNPPSEFEAEGSGGIIHIILKKNRQDGLQGVVTAQYRQQVEKPYYTAGTSLNYKLKKLYLSGSINGTKDQSNYIATNLISYADRSSYDSFTDRYNDNNLSSYRLGAAYDLSLNQSLSVQAMYTNSRMNQYFDSSIQLHDSVSDVTGLANSVWIRKPASTGTTLNYTLKTDSLGSGLKVIGDYLHSQKTETNHVTSLYSDPLQNTDYRNSTPNTTKLYSLQSDFMQVFDKALQLKAGVKYVNTLRDNEVVKENFIDDDWVRDESLSNRFIYKEQLLMGYASLEKKWEHTSIQAGLRAEQTYMDGNSVTSDTRFSRKYLNLFPSLFIMRSLDETKGTALTFNYSRRLRRPSFADLNPFRLQFNDYLTQLGNPDLLPEYTHKVGAGYTFLQGISAEVYYANTNNKIAQLARAIDDKSIEYQTRNFNHSNEYGVSLYAPVKLFKWWSTSNNLAYFHLGYQLADIDLDQTTFQAQSMHSFAFPKLFDADLWISYSSPYVSANSRQAHQFGTDLSFSKKIWDNKGRIRFYVADIFNTFREKDVTTYEGTRIDFYQKRPTRTVSLSFTYSFSAGKPFKDKKIEQSNDDEKRRIGN